MTEYVFTFLSQQMKLRFITYRKNTRSSEFAPWQESIHWRLSLDRPEAPVVPPVWAVEEIRRQITNKIELEK